MRNAILLFPFALLACGGSQTYYASSMVSLRGAGVSPSTVSLAGGTQLQFTNDDAADHRVISTDCAELNSPTLAPGASFSATMGAGPKMCAFSDALLPGNDAFQGTVTVQQDPGSGNPYGY